jgi:Spy/CpxP family protein refolding chaperone
MRTDRILGFAAALVLIVAVACAGVVWAQTSGSPMAKGFGRRMMALTYVARQLNLSDAQRQQIKTIVKAHKQDIKALVDGRFAARRALRQAIAGGNADQIAAAASQMSSVELKAAQMKALIRGQVFGEVLQPDQRSKAEELLSQFEQKADARHQRIDRFLEQQ